MLAGQKPKISIITATLNSEKYLEETIKSVIGQTYKNIEYIIIDGKSTDGTLDIVNQYKGHISKIISEHDSGIYNAFNKGIRYATGDIIYFLNSDDYLFNENVIEYIAGIFIRNEDLSIVYGNVLSVDTRYGFENISGKALKLDDLKNGEMAPHQGMFVKKHLFEKYGYFDEKYPIVADYDFFIKCVKSNEEKMRYINKIIAVYSLTGGAGKPENLKRFNEIKRNVMINHFGSTDYSNGIEFQSLYREWLEQLLLKDRGITNVLHRFNIKKVAIFGTMKTAMYLLRDLSKENIKVEVFLDNNENMHGKSMSGINVEPITWLLENNSKVDAIVISIESPLRESQVIHQMNEMFSNNPVKLFTWKEIVELSRP